MIRIAITQAAFDAIADTLPLGSAMYEAKTTADGGGRYPVSTRGAGRARAIARSFFAWRRSNRRGPDERHGPRSSG